MARDFGQLMSDSIRKRLSDPDEYFQTDHLRNDLKGHSARSGLLTVSSQGIKFVLSTVSAVVLSRLLTPSDYGIVGMVAIVLNFASMFQYLGLGGATVHWPKINHRQVSMLFWLNLSMSTMIALLMVSAAPLIAWFFQEPRVIAVSFGYSLSVFITGLWIQHEAILTRQMRFGFLMSVDIAALVVGLCVAVATAWRGAGYWALVYNQLAITSVQAVCYWVICKWRPGLPALGSGVRPMLQFGSHFTGTNIMKFLSRNVDNILIGRFWGAEQLGLYSRSYQLLMLPIQQIYSPISSVALPALSRLTDSEVDYRRAYLGIVEKIAMITMPGVMLMCVCSDWIVLFILGPQWEGTARIFMFLGLAALIQPVASTCYWLFSTQRRTREMFVWSICSALIATSSILAGLPWGAIGVAASYAVGDLFIQTPRLIWYAGRKGPVRSLDIFRTLVPSICAATLTLLVLAIFRYWLDTTDFIALRIAAAAILTLLTSLGIFAVLPAGRAALQSFCEITAAIVRRGKTSAAAID
jgi:PST family polysaccharide transporter